MALTITNQPQLLSSANDDLVYTCLESSLYSQTNFKYICDIYVGGIRVAQLKAFPNPISHYGVFNIGNVMRNYVQSNLTYLPYTAGIRVDKFPSHTTYVECQFGYEYGTNVAQYLNQQSRTNYFSNTYNKRRTTSILTNPILSYKKDNFATNRPAKTDVYVVTTGNSPLLIPFFSGIVYPSSPQNLVFRVNKYNKDGTFALSSTITSTGSAIDYTMIQLDLSAASLNAALGTTFIDDNVLYYNVYANIQISAGSNITSTSPNFYPFCENKYEVFTLVWMNQYGGYDSYQFSKKSKRSYASEKKTFERIPYSINSSTGAMTYFSQGIMNESTIVYDSKFKESMSFNTNILDEVTYEWLAELILSPSVFVVIDSAFIPVVVKETNYDFKKRVNDKIYNLAINVELNQQMNTQYR
jgi:hypothetical protein